MEVVEANPAAAGMVLDGFTEDDLAAADLLVQLSVSGGGEEEEEDHHGEACSSSMLSVNNNADQPAVAPASAERVDTDEMSMDRRATQRSRLVAPSTVERADVAEIGMDRRAKKRYRLVKELYASTRPVKGGDGAGTGAGGKRKREEMGNEQRR